MNGFNMEYICTFEKTIDIKGYCCKLSLQNEQNKVVYLWIRETVNKHMFDVCILKYPKNLCNGQLIEMVEHTFQRLTTQNKTKWEINVIMKKGGEVIK